MEFNPQVVSEYRLIGYQNRKLADADFTNDKVDAGEIGAGHQVTAIYEITLVGNDQPWLPTLRYAPVAQQLSYNVSELGWLKLRYKAPGQTRSKAVNFPLPVNGSAANSKDFIFASAVAGFAELLCCDKYLQRFDYADSERLAKQGRGVDSHGYRAGFIRLVQQAGLIEATK
jgi:Ca-activated chloride channel family protein